MEYKTKCRLIRIKSRSAFKFIKTIDECLQAFKDLAIGIRSKAGDGKSRDLLLGSLEPRSHGLVETNKSRTLYVAIDVARN